MGARPDLVYYPDSEPGIRRRRQGRGFSYLAPDGTRIDAREERSRIEALAVPPAYEDVWICPLPIGHLQATGRDARARKQYRYHPDWTAFRAERKFSHLADFGAALPRLRQRILRDLRQPPGGPDFATAAILALLDRASLRVEHPDYTRDNRSYGATTLSSRHVALDEGRIRLAFRAKGGKRVETELRDATLNRVLAKCDDLPGRTLVSWTDDAGDTHRVRSEMVNAVLQEITGSTDITAKTFRTWSGSTEALAVALSERQPTIKALSEAAAERLHNTPTMARNSYIHPRVIDLVDVAEAERAELAESAPAVRGLRRNEAQLLHLLRAT